MKSINLPIMNVLYISKSSFMNCAVRRFLKVYIKFYDGFMDKKRLSGHFRGTDKINLKIRNVQLQTNLL